MARLFKKSDEFADLHPHRAAELKRREASKISVSVTPQNEVPDGSVTVGSPNVISQE